MDISLLIKPASGRCNMQCQYCFYIDETKNREIADFGVMTYETLENIIKKALESEPEKCTFGFQGGEPALRGLEFFELAVALQKQYNTNHIKIKNTFQTNGLLIDEQWASFFHREHILVGLSIDGTAAVHNKNRKDMHGIGTLQRAMDATKLLQKHKVDFNILTVVTNKTAEHIQAVYRFFMNHGFKWQQYIPCLDPLDEQKNWLSADAYGEFLIRLFSCWLQDYKRGEHAFIRQFENYIAMLLGEPADTCSMMGCCAPQYVIEADGSVYPCDFYVLDPYRLGNLNTDTLKEIDEVRTVSRFIEISQAVDPQCHHCQYYYLCRGGCRRDWDHLGSLHRTRFCKAYQMFFHYALEDLLGIAKRIAGEQ